MSTLPSYVKKQTTPIYHNKAPKPHMSKFLVFITGRQGCGVSTLMNCLTHNEIPMSLFVPVKVTHGMGGETVTVTYRDPYRPNKVIPRKQVSHLDSDCEKAKEIAYLTVTAELENPNVEFVKSIGVGYTEEYTREFEYRADVIVMVLSVAHLGTDFERKYIQQHFAGRDLRNVFFVINGYNLLKPEDEADFLKQLKSLIGCVFTDANGNFDEELYKQRVFPVDSIRSESARMGSILYSKKGDEWVQVTIAPEEDAYTGVPELEQALNQFLDTQRRNL